MLQVEEWEKHLIALGRLVNVNFMRGARRSTNRDFKLIASPSQEMGCDKQRSDPRPHERQEQAVSTANKSVKLEAHTAEEAELLLYSDPDSNAAEWRFVYEKMSKSSPWIIK